MSADKCVFKEYMAKGNDGVDELIQKLNSAATENSKFAGAVSTFVLTNTNHEGKGRVCRAFSMLDGFCCTKTDFCSAIMAEVLGSNTR
jgi:hypothetical protein